MEGENKVIVKKESFIKTLKGEVTQYYEIVKKLGEGGFGKVYKGKHKISGDLRAIKEIRKDKIIDPTNFENEIKILSMLDHPNIIRLFEIIENDKYFYVVMELCSGGELLSRMQGSYKEKEAAILFNQIVSAINYLHKKGICHRDLKPGNIMFYNESKDSPLKIIDFGLSVLLKKPNYDSLLRMQTTVGTVYFMSPEILKGNYSEKCDIWALGVILFMMLGGYAPFNGANDTEIYKNISACKFEFSPDRWNNASKYAKELIQSMLCPEKKRITAQEIIEGKWLSHKLKSKKDKKVISFNYERFKKFKDYPKIKQAVMIFIASRLNTEETIDIVEIFNKINQLKTGAINFNEFKFFLINEQNQEIIDGEDDEEIKENFLSVDIDHNKKIDFSEFIAANMDEEVYLRDERLQEAFNVFDTDGAGTITVKEIINTLKLNNLEDAKLLASLMIEKVDNNKDGQIDYNEFCKMMKGN